MVGREVRTVSESERGWPATVAAVQLPFTRTRNNTFLSAALTKAGQGPYCLL